MIDGPTIASLIVSVIEFLFVLMVFFVPAILIYIFWKSWIKYVRGEFFASQKYITLEFRLPKEILKSPVAMEIFITSLFQTGGESTWYDRYWKGQTRPWFSLELVSIDGQVKFIIWTRERFKNHIESQVYAQYPDVEIFEVQDYTSGITVDPNKNNLWGCDFKKSAASYIPIKTFVDYGLDKDPKEEFKIDPITPVIEFLGSLRQGEQAWFQIIIRAHKAEQKVSDPGAKWYHIFGKSKMVDWKHDAGKDIEKLMRRDKKDKEENKLPDLSFTKGEKSKVEAIERSLSKFAFDCGIRGIYIADKDKFSANNFGGITGSFRQFNSPSLNGFAPTNLPSFDFPWQDISGKKVLRIKRNLLKCYKKRLFFYPEFFPSHYHVKPFVMTTEELATIYHFPGGVVRTPTFGRIMAKKVEAPPNLPI